MVNWNEKKIPFGFIKIKESPQKLHTAVSSKVVLRTRKSLRENVESCLGNDGFYGCLSEPQGVSAW